MHKTVGKLQALAFLLLGCLPVAADTVYKTVDDKGVVSFSDTPPEGDPEVETLQIATPPPQDAELAQQRLEDMRATTDRMASDRREREKHRAELQATAPQQQQQQQYSSGYNDYYPPIYTSSNVRRRDYYGNTPWRPNYRPKPEHPIARPPIRPGHSYRPQNRPNGNVNTGSNSQLMRPMVSPRR